VIGSFKDQGTEDLFNGLNTAAARKKCPDQLRRIARRRLDHLDSVSQLVELRVPPGNQLEPLKGDRQGQYSIRINEKYRVCFNWSPDGPFNVDVTDYH
jgi:proteic killer suppression protein